MICPLVWVEYLLKASIITVLLSIFPLIVVVICLSLLPGHGREDTQPCPAASLRTQQWKKLLSDKPKMLPGDAANQRGENLCLGCEYSPLD